MVLAILFFFSSRRRHTRSYGDWSSDVCSSDLLQHAPIADADTAPGSFVADVLEDEAWKSFKLVLGTQLGEEVIEVETRHGIPTTYLSPAHEILGTDFSRSVGGSQMSECPARYRWRGKTGSGMIERI